MMFKVLISVKFFPLCPEIYGHFVLNITVTTLPIFPDTGVISTSETLDGVIRD